METITLKCVISGIKIKCRKTSNLWIDLVGDPFRDNFKILEALQYFRVVNKVVINGYKTRSIEKETNLVIVNMVPSYQADMTEQFNNIKK